MIGLLGIIVFLIKGFAESRGNNLVALNPVFIPCLLYGLWDFIPSVKLSRKVVLCAFPIYLMHQILLSIIRIVMPANSALTYLGSVFLAVFGAVFISFALRSITPRLANLAFGGRV